MSHIARRVSALRSGAFGLAAALSLGLAGTAQAADENVMVVFDGSNSMWGQIDGTAKIEIARGVMENLLGDWTEDRKVGLMAYGHRQRGDCSDIETLVAPGADTRAAILDRINAITPTGKTPLTDAIELAATELSYTDTPATVVLISDGLESCERDPCALAKTLKSRGVAFTAHVVGFGLGADQDSGSLSCIAERTGGQYIQAANADELGRALGAISTAVAAAPEPEPVPEPEPELPAVTLTAPDSALAGSSFRIGWSPTLDPADYVTIVPVGTPEGDYGGYVRVRDHSEADFRAPAQTGLYELRYMTQKDRNVLGVAPIEITEPEVSVSGPESALAGSTIPVSWTGAVHGRDYITIVPMGADEGSHGDYTRVSDKAEGKLQAPADTGMYEIRYVLDEGKRTMAAQPIEITEPEVSVSGPESALAGSTIPVAWTGAVHGRDYITIVPMGADEGSHGDYTRVSDKAEGKLQAPADTGMYEIRYVLDEGKRTMAAQPIEITEPEVSVSGPESALAGSTIPVAWTGAVHGRDYITIVPMGADEGSHGDYTRVSDKAEGRLQAPADTGMYEIRYVLDEGKRTMAAQPIEITAPEVTLSAQGELRAGDTLRVEWSGAVHPRDYITLVPMGTPDGDHAEYFRVADAGSRDMSAPDQPGLYELRYMLNEGRRVLARHPVEILDADAPLSSGASLSAPDSAAAGSMIEVGWSVDSSSADQRITLARADQAIFTWLSATKIEGEPPLRITLPDEPGSYELRFLDVSNQAVLARKVLVVE
ncbi:MAG: VWA domain-containing protein [Pseudomonadota bacterium]